MADNTHEIVDSQETQNNIIATQYNQSFTVTPIENSVIEKAMSSDNQAFETLFMGTYRYVFAAIRKYLNNDQDIYDAIQDTYMRVYKGISRLDSSSSFYPWLYRIAVNCAKDIIEDNKIYNKTVPLDDETKITDEKSNNSDVTADVSEVLKQLPPEQAELLIRVYYDKMRVAEIARMQGVPASTVQNRLKAAKKNLKELLKIRGIDKPIYGGEFVSMISTALRNAIGTELLSMAIAEEILHNVTGGKDNKGAFVVSAFARKMRNKAVKNIAAILLLTCLLTTTLVIFLVNIIIKNFSDKENVNAILSTNSTVSEYIPPISSDTTTSLESTVVDSSATSSTVSDNPSSVLSSSLPSTPSSLPTATPQNEVMTFAGSFETTENFGTFVENGYLDIAISGNYVYGYEPGYLNTVEIVDSNWPFDLGPMLDFGKLYGESGCFLNVFEGRIYWINQNSESKFVLNRCNLDGSGHYYKVFDEFSCTFLTDMLVAKDGVYFLAGIHGDFNHIDGATLYRTDFDFKIKDTIEDVADYTIIKDKIYYLFGKGNSGRLFSADRDTFDNRICILTDYSSYGTVCSVGDFLVLSEYNRYKHSEVASGTDLKIMDTVSGEVVRQINGEAGDSFIINDVSKFNGGTVIYTNNGVCKQLNITTGEIKEFVQPLGTIYNNYIFYIKNHKLAACDIYGNKHYSLH